jgi:hypothetical protein
MMEQNLALTVSEQKRERDNLGRIEVSSLKANEDFRNMLG